MRPINSRNTVRAGNIFIPTTCSVPQDFLLESQNNHGPLNLTFVSRTAKVNTIIMIVFLKKNLHFCFQKKFIKILECPPFMKDITQAFGSRIGSPNPHSERILWWIVINCFLRKQVPIHRILLFGEIPSWLFFEEPANICRPKSTPWAWPLGRFLSATPGIRSVRSSYGCRIWAVPWFLRLEIMWEAKSKLYRNFERANQSEQS